MARTAAWGVVAGVPLVAVGITTTQLDFGSLPECAAVLLTATAGLLSAGLHLRLALAKRGRAGVLWGVAVAAMGVSMVLALLYGCRVYFPLAWLDIPWMRAVHGMANALGFGLAGVLAWNLNEDGPPRSHGDKTVRLR